MRAAGRGRGAAASGPGSAGRCCLAALAFALVVDAAMAAFALYGVGLYDECVAGGYLSSYEIAIPYYVGSSFSVLLALHSAAFGASAVATGAFLHSRRRRGGDLAGWGLPCALLVCVSVALAGAGCALTGPTVTNMQTELQRSQAALPGDYVEDEFFSEMTLDDFEGCFSDGGGSSGDEEGYLVYIGRAGCRECVAFEEAISPVLSSDGVDEGLPTYYTSEDRDGPRSAEMYALLDELGVGSVPAVLAASNGKVVHKWDDPIADVGQIELFLREGRLP